MTMRQELEDPRPSNIAGTANPNDGSRQAETVIALHCSGADSSEWNKLAAAIGPCVNFIAPGLLGSSEHPRWAGQRTFSVLEEALQIVEQIDNLPGPIHLVGHSYGGAVALKVAELRPLRIKSIALYEPSTFHVLRQRGKPERNALREIEILASRISTGLTDGNYVDGARAFVDYWNGPGAWDGLREEIRARLISWFPNASLHFHALINDETPLGQYRFIMLPVLLIQGEHARRPSRKIIELMSDAFRSVTVAEVTGAGHMGPITHADRVNTLLLEHFKSADQDATAERFAKEAA